MKPTKAAIKALHVRQVDRVRKLIEDAAFKYLVGELKLAADNLEAGGVGVLAMIYKPRQRIDALKSAVGPAIGRAMALGAAVELGLRKSKKIKASSASEILAEWGISPEDFATEMPPELIEAIEAALVDSFQQEYWASVPGTVANHIQGILKDGTTQGLSIRDMAHEIENATMFARTRATAIARTESTRALNRGHTLGIEQTENETGVLLGKTWLSVAGATSREEHIAADGQTVRTDQQFNLGGFACDYPGDASLPPEHAINCLCTIIAGDLDLADDEAPRGREDDIPDDELEI